MKLLPQWGNAYECGELLAELATTALINEAELTPKPGLVDLNNSGAHNDLNIAMMRISAYTLRDSFSAMATIAYQQRPSQILREQLAGIGREAERLMMSATGGVNTHRGAIWALGLLTAGAAICPLNSSSTQIAAIAGGIARYSDRYAPTQDSNGTKVQRRFGVSGARGEAQNGFPHVIRVALPMLKSARRNGVKELHARLDTLLAIMSTLEDTCLLHRGGQVALELIQQTSRKILSVGGTSSSTGWDLLHQLDAELIERHISPSGCADLLAATLFLDSFENVC
ncbi:MAG: triphosphoribosyl-dephospho-CoA synthase [Paenibacillaceae bacterium]